MEHRCLIWLWTCCVLYVDLGENAMFPKFATIKVQNNCCEMLACRLNVSKKYNICFSTSVCWTPEDFMLWAKQYYSFGTSCIPQSSELSHFSSIILSITAYSCVRSADQVISRVHDWNVCRPAVYTLLIWMNFMIVQYSSCDPDDLSANVCVRGCIFQAVSLLRVQYSCACTWIADHVLCESVHGFKGNLVH